MESKFVVTEGIEGVWHYHLSKSDNIRTSLCGKSVMPTSLSISSWGVVTHLNEKYCKECFAVYHQTARKD